MRFHRTSLPDLVPWSQANDESDETARMTWTLI